MTEGLLKTENGENGSYPLGDEREVLLHAALTRAGKADQPSRDVESRSSEDDFLLLGYPSSGNELVDR